MVLIDALLALSLICVALSVLLVKDLYQALVLFIVFGLLMALVWVRMQAPDLALAEAAIGAGLTGVLLLDALGHLRHHQHHPSLTPRQKQLRAFLLLLMASTLLVWLGAAVLEAPSGQIALNQQVAERLPETGVAHPITGVLLAFRAYDTFLEVAVILVAVVVGLSLRFSQADTPAETQLNTPLLHGMLVWLLPLMLLVGAYLLWIGSYRSGGAFQSAAVLGALVVLMRMAGLRLPMQDQVVWLRLGLVSGLGVFLLAGSYELIRGGAFLAWPEGQGGAWILAVETALAFSLGWLLFSLFEASPAPQQASLTRDGGGA